MAAEEGALHIKHCVLFACAESQQSGSPQPGSSERDPTAHLCLLQLELIQSSFQ